MLKTRRLSHPYKGNFGDSFKQKVVDERTISLWRGNTANVHSLLPYTDRDGYWKLFAGNLASGFSAGASLVFS
ncbi:hydroxyproline O-arabinosyltransferase [Ranunculus cassubicifolius]